MKIYTLVGISLGLAATSLASADAPNDPMSQGGVDAVLSFCQQVNPAGAAAYHSLEESLRGKGLDDWKRSDRKAAYFKAYTEVRGALESARQDWALQACVSLASRPR
jgi:hypothetical protein